MKRTSLSIVSALLLATGLFAEDPKVQLPQQSPLVTLKQNLGPTDIEIVYSRPGVKGREIYGKLIPYGSVWRTGANAATKITFNTPVKLNGTEVAAGTYALFTIPGESEWTIIISKDATTWGAYSYNEKNDVIRTKSTPVKLTEPVETFTIDINDIRTESATLNLIWDKTKVPVKLEFAAIATSLAQLETALAAPGEKSAGFYNRAIGFYLSNSKELSKVLAWANEGTARYPKDFGLLLNKARVQAKLGDKPAALATAKAAIDMAKAAGGNQGNFLKAADEFTASLR